MLVGEVNLAPARVARYTRPDELHQAFACAVLAAPWDARAWQSIISGLLKFLVRGGAPVTWVVENHGVVIQDFEPLGKFDTIWNILLQAQHGATGQPDQLGCELECLVGGGELGDD